MTPPLSQVPKRVVSKRVVFADVGAKTEATQNGSHPVPVTSVAESRTDPHEHADNRHVETDLTPQTNA